MKERVGIFREGKREKNFFSIVTQKKRQSKEQVPGHT